jgi:hypothetical protein
MLFAFVVESTSRKTVSATPDGQVDGAGTNQIIFLNQHGFQVRAAMGGGSRGRQGLLIAGSLGQNGFDEFVGDYQEELVHSFVLQQEFEEGVGWIAAGGAADIRHYGHSQVRGVGDMVDGCEVLSRRPGGLVGMVGKAAWDLNMASAPGPRLMTNSPASWITRPALRGGRQVERRTCRPYVPCVWSALPADPAQTGEHPPLEITPRDGHTLGRIYDAIDPMALHGYGSLFRAMPTFGSFIAFCYITDSFKQPCQPAYGIFASILIRRGPLLAISTSPHHGCSRLQQSDKQYQRSPNQCRFVSFILLGDSLPPFLPRSSPMERLNGMYDIFTVAWIHS